MLRLFAALDAVAASASPVLIFGERGSGKEYIARQIHKKRGRAGSFVSVKCSCFAPSLLAGLESSATLFLDGIQFLGCDGQAFLSSFLRPQAGLPSGPKLLASACEDLEAWAASSGFDRELLVLLDSIRVCVPPLRERKEDVVPLAVFFLKDFACEMGLAVQGFSPDAVRKLEAYHWPGNVRELRNVVERSLLRCRSGRVEAADVELLSDRVFGGGVPSGLGLREAVKLFKKSYVAQAIAAGAGNKAEAARMLGVERTYLFKLIHDLGLDMGQEC